MVRVRMACVNDWGRFVLLCQVFLQWCVSFVLSVHTQADIRSWCTWCQESYHCAKNSRVVCNQSGEVSIVDDRFVVACIPGNFGHTNALSLRPPFYATQTIAKSLCKNRARNYFGWYAATSRRIAQNACEDQRWAQPEQREVLKSTLDTILMDRKFSMASIAAY
jgi:hypothetical protein